MRPYLPLKLGPSSGGSTRFADSNVLDTTKDGDTRETNVQAVVSILVPNEARNPQWDRLVQDFPWSLCCKSQMLLCIYNDDTPPYAPRR